jgi:hypothetical protein
MKNLNLKRNHNKLSKNFLWNTMMKAKVTMRLQERDLFTELENPKNLRKLRRFSRPLTERHSRHQGYCLQVIAQSGQEEALGLQPNSQRADGQKQILKK